MTLDWASASDGAARAAATRTGAERRCMGSLLDRSDERANWIGRVARIAAPTPFDRLSVRPGRGTRETRPASVRMRCRAAARPRRTARARPRRRAAHASAVGERDLAHDRQAEAAALAVALAEDAVEALEHALVLGCGDARALVADARPPRPRRRRRRRRSPRSPAGCSGWRCRSGWRPSRAASGRCLRGSARGRCPRRRGRCCV